MAGISHFRQFAGFAAGGQVRIRGCARYRRWAARVDTICNSDGGYRGDSRECLLGCLIATYAGIHATPERNAWDQGRVRGCPGHF